MLTIFGRNSKTEKFCDGHSRRDFLTIGSAAALGGITLPQLLRAEAQQSLGRQHKAVINVFLPGGPPHQDMWDIKQDAPSEIRGEFQPISTNVSGIQIGELFPKMAKMMDSLKTNIGGFVQRLLLCRGVCQLYRRSLQRFLLARTSYHPCLR